MNGSIVVLAAMTTPGSPASPAPATGTSTSSAQTPSTALAAPDTGARIPFSGFALIAGGLMLAVVPAALGRVRRRRG